MRTPSLVTRVVVVGVAVVTLLVVGIDLLLYFSLQSSLTDNVDTALAISRAGIDGPLDRLVRLELIISPLVIALAFMLLRLIAEVALRPFDEIAAAARRTAGGLKGERLRPDRPTTRLGLVASAYDDMLDALEAKAADARRAQATSERLQERYRQILETAREAFVAFDDKGFILEWNAEAERTFGWPRQEVIGRTVADTILAADAREVPYAEPARFLSADGGPATDRLVEFTAVHRDGHTFRAGSTVWITRQDGEETINAFMWDVTDRLKAQEAMSRLAAIVESSDEAMISTDLDGRILTWNAGAERMYGYSAAEAVGHDLSLIVPSGERHKVDEVLEQVEHGARVQRVELKRRRKDGTVIDVALTISAMHDHSGKLWGAASVGRNITEELRTQVELESTNAKLESTLGALKSALEEARASEEATRKFLDDAAHQLRAPITSLRASAETLLRGVDPNERDRLLGAVVRETSRASRLMSGLLHMARLNQGRRFDTKPCDLVALCQEEVERAHWVAPQLDLAVRDEGPAPLGKPELDADAVGEILANLLDNARRHARSKIDVCVGRQNGRVELKVANDGPSIPTDMAEAVFDRFVSLDGRGGAGLGLPIARELARAQGGELSYERQAFVLRLPARRGPES